MGWSSQSPKSLVLALVFIPEQGENNEGFKQGICTAITPSAVTESKWNAAMGALGNQLI